MKSTFLDQRSENQDQVLILVVPVLSEFQILNTSPDPENLIIMPRSFLRGALAIIKQCIY